MYEGGNTEKFLLKFENVTDAKGIDKTFLIKRILLLILNLNSIYKIEF